jgi:hypothetical protein
MLNRRDVVYRRAGPHRNRIALDVNPPRESIHRLPAECRVLVFKPGECVLKML